MGRTFTFEADNKEHTIKFTMNSVCDIEEAADRTPIQVLCGEEKLSYSTLRLLVQHGLKWKNPGITKQRAGDLLKQFVDEGGDLNKFTRDILLLLAESTGSKIKKEDIDDAEGAEGEEDEQKE